MISSRDIRTRFFPFTNFSSGTLAVGFILMLLILLYPLQKEINCSRIREDLSEALVVMPGDFINFFIIGGFRGIAADVLWIRADDYWHRGQWYKVLPIYRAIAWLQPHFLTTWALGAWHMAYNLYAYSDIPEQKLEFLQMGIDFLKDGIIQNRDKYDLYFELGWTYFDKAKNYDEAARFLGLALRFDEVPTYVDRLFAHAYRKKEDLENERDAWKAALKAHPEDDYHVKLSREFLKRCEEKMKQ